jgi:hypothetical protein
MCAHCTCNSAMSLKEALKIAESCRSDLYPPTNPNVLLKAAQVVYKEMGVCLDLYSILDWTKSLIESRCSVCL